MDNLEIFENKEFGEIRTTFIDGMAWFVGKDIADTLGYSETNAMTRRLDKEDVISTKMTGMNMKSILINESGLYCAILGSKLPSAKKFKRWVTSEVLPQIRQTGGYIPVNKDETNEEFLARAFVIATETLKRKDEIIANKDKQLEEQKPLVDFANKVSNSSNLIDMGKMAKLLKDEHIKIGRNRLFDWLRRKEILMKNNIPYQRYIDGDYFRVKESTYETPYGTKTQQTTYVTGKGQIYITEKLRKEYCA